MLFLPNPKYLLHNVKLVKGPKSNKLVTAYFSVRSGKNYKFFIKEKGGYIATFINIIVPNDEGVMCMIPI